MNFIQVFFVILLCYVNTIAQYNYKWERHDINSKASIRGLFAVNQDVVWLGGSGGLVARTINGGVTWEILTVPGGEMLDFRDVHAFDEDKALIMSAGAGQKSKIFKTDDGGQSWQVVHGNTYKDGFFNGMDFWDEKNGVLAGDPVNGHMYIAVTVDGGESWVKVDDYSIPEIEYQEYGFAASGTHITTFGDSSAWIGTGGRVARIFYTKDMGNTWEAQITPMIQGATSTGVFSIAFRNHLNGIAIGGDYTKENEGKDNVIYTNDRGKKWNLIDEHMEFRSCVRHIDGMYVAVGPSGANYSFSDGKSWNPIGGGIGFHTLSIGKNKNSIWAAGSDGKVARLVEIKYK
ncbi:MAG: YCF48-related protein [Cyclobacteriaceae bacterium]|nr:YCF48-related protein [Cyclobacteriaceae bacterium]